MLHTGTEMVLIITLLKGCSKFSFWW